MIAQGSTISSLEVTEPDFAALKAQAVDWLQQWCGDQWTDFNDHDPGLMILDELLYALTELSYRAALPLPQLLGAGDSLGQAGTTFHAAEEILPMQPLTAGDYARLLYDDIPGLLYARVEARPANGSPGSEGSLQARIAIDPVTGVAAHTAAVAAAVELLNTHRNLGERFAEVALETPVVVGLKVELQLAAGADPALVAANLYFAVHRALLPGPRFVTLEEALRTQPIDAVFCGPRLRRGVLRDGDMPGLLTWPEARERAAQALLGVAAVRNVGTIEFLNEAEARGDGTPRLYAPGPEVHVQLKPATAASGTDLIVIFQAASTRAVALVPSDEWGDEADVVQTRAAGLIAAGGEKPRVQFNRLARSASGTLAPAGEPRPAVSDYFSVQNQLPPCFALQAGALPPDVDSRRHAQVLQLKGYLLVFEQLMANYLAQLAATNNYFSCLPQARTAFTQTLGNVPGVFPLVCDRVLHDGALDAAARDARERAFWADPANPYSAGLEDIAEDVSAFLERRSRVLDHLLASFNEGSPRPEHGNYETIAAREALLRNYPRLGHDRAAAARIADQAPGPQWGRRRWPRSRSGLERKIQLLLRRDSQPPVENEDATELIRHRDDFYFVIEPVRFLPPDGAGVPLEDFSFPADTFAPSLFHVFINWTDAPLNGPFIAHAEERVLEEAPAHLWHRFVWLDPRGGGRAKSWRFLKLFHRWKKKKYPPLLRPVRAEDGSPGLNPDDAAGHLLAWLLETSSPAEPGKAP